MNHILLIFKQYVHMSSEKKIISIHNFIAEIRKIKRTKKEIVLTNAKKSITFLKK